MPVLFVGNFCLVTWQGLSGKMGMGMTVYPAEAWKQPAGKCDFHSRLSGGD